MTVNALIDKKTNDSAEATEPNSIEQMIEEFSISKLEFSNVDENAEKEKKIFDKYRELVDDLTVEEQLEILGMSLKKAFPPIDRDVEKLVIDLNIIVYQYMQKKMESDQEVRVEKIRSTVRSALDKVSAALLTMMAENK